MFWLCLGVLVWSGVHLMPRLASGLKAGLVDALGQPGYRIAFSVAIVAAIVLIVLGWRSTAPIEIYHLPEWTGPLTFLLMILGFILFGAGKHATVIKRYVRHPQLTGIIVWAVAHLLANGDSRALVLFGGLGLWAIVEIIVINKAEGAWEKPLAPGLKVEFKGLAISLVIFAVAFVAHPYFAGVSAIPR